MKRVWKVLSQGLQGSIDCSFGLSLLVYFATVVFVGSWVIFKVFYSQYDHKLDHFALVLVGVSVLWLVVGYFSYRPDKPMPVPRPQLTDEQIYYNIVDELVRRHKNNGLHFDSVYELVLRHYSGFSNAQNTIDVLAQFAYQTGLLIIDFDLQRIYPTPLAINPDDRTAANMLIAKFSQMPDLNSPDIFLGSDVTTINGLIEELRQLTPRGLKLVRLDRAANERVWKAKAS